MINKSDLDEAIIGNLRRENKALIDKTKVQSKIIDDYKKLSIEKGLEIEKLRGLLKEYEQWEADLINENKLWWPNVAKDFLRGPLYDKMLDLQSKRNLLLKTNGNESNVFSRDECVFNYCPHPELCKDKCIKI